jgi:hypothetical protein
VGTGAVVGRAAGCIDAPTDSRLSVFAAVNRLGRATVAEPRQE